MEAKKEITQRPPIVVVLGHVDHGKTTLLDTLRKTNVASREAGGITQAIGASVIETKEGKKITFIDTPGHAAFTKMRGRGAKVADIAVLVVAQDDGVAPQTKEALQIIRDAGIPFVVAGTKADVAGVSAEALKGQLEKEEVYFEGRGGDIPFVSVSARNGQGVDEIIDMLTLMAEVSEIKGDANSPIEGVVIESGKDNMGSFATVVVRNGNIKVGSTIFADQDEAKVRALIDDKGSNIKEVGPGFPARVFGFTKVPQVGSKIGNNSQKSEAVEQVKTKGIFDLRRLKDDEIPLILKADNAGSLEAIIASLPDKVVVVDSGVGEITSSDIINAKTGNAYVFSFGLKIPGSIIKLAEAEKITISKFDIIYELLKELEDIMKRGKVVETGKAEILAIFPFDNKKVAGSKVINGRINKGDQIIVTRGDKEVGKAKAVSVRKGKQEISSVGQSEEFGVILEPQLDFAIGDVLVSVAK